MYTQEHINYLRDIINHLINNNIEMIYLFGSYANNTANSYSDIDIAIITDRKLERKEKLRILNDLWWKTSKKGISVDFIIKSVSDFENEKELPTLSRIIYNEGKIIWQRN